jgi:hypothetical protein
MREWWKRWREGRKKRYGPIVTMAYRKTLALVWSRNVIYALVAAFGAAVLIPWLFGREPDWASVGYVALASGGIVCIEFVRYFFVGAADLVEIGKRDHQRLSEDLASLNATAEDWRRGVRARNAVRERLNHGERLMSRMWRAHKGALQNQNAEDAESYRQAVRVFADGVAAACRGEGFDSEAAYIEQEALAVETAADYDAAREVGERLIRIVRQQLQSGFFSDRL